MGALEDAPIVEAHDRQTWRSWLEANHASGSGVWLVTWRSSSDRVGLDYDVMVEEALCFGWVDSQGGRVDDERSKLYFAPRRRGSGWAATNKARVERLTAEGRMAPAGLAAIERAKADGSWTVLDGPERLEVPADLEAALDASPPAATHWATFSPSVRKQILTWIAVAKRAETRSARITETATLAQRGERANQPRSTD